MVDLLGLHLVAIGRRQKDGKARLDTKVFVLVDLLQHLVRQRDKGREKGGR